MKPLVLGVFEHISPNGMSGSTWLHPDNTSTGYLTLEYWTRLARKLEDASIDFLFLADSYGMPIVDGDVPDSALRAASHIPYGDPFAVISAIAAVTEHLGIVVTSSTVFEEPYASARRFATLDHLSRGRMGWNVVTSASAGPAAAMFGREMTAHDTRYDIADDYMELSYRFLEGSWEDDAVLADRAAQVYAIPERVHRVDYVGPHFRSSGVFPVEPSPQRMPVLFQAGSSGRGREFAARHAECVFLQGTTAPAVAASVADIRTRAVGYGREGDDIKILVGLSTIIGETDEDARRKFEQFQALSTDETAAAQFAYNTGIDLMSYDLDRPLPADVSTEQGRTNVERFMGGDGRPPHTVRQILDEMKARGLRGLLLTGTAASVADQIESYVSATGVDGFLLESYINPGSYDDIAQLLLPVLRARGLAPEPYTTTTLRERFAGAGNPHLADTHPGAAYRPRRAASV